MKLGLKIFALLVLVILVGTVSIFFSACDPPIPIQIENQSNMSLIIYVQSHEAGTVNPNSTIKMKNVPMTLSHYLIEAKNSQGEIIFPEISALANYTI